MSAQPGEPGPAVRLREAVREALVFGGVDGTVVALGLVAGLAVARQAHAAVWHSALSGGLAELAGMTAGRRQSDGSSWGVSLACGTAALAGAVIPGIPYLVLRGSLSLVVSLSLVAAAGVLIGHLTDPPGWRGYMQVFGLLLAAAALTAASGFA